MKERNWSVYVHINKENRKRYVGITSQLPDKRWLNGHGYRDHLKIGRAIKKYGWDSFDHIVLRECLCETEAKDLEKELIIFWNTTDDRFGYNITSGGDGVAGFHHSLDSKKKMSDAKAGSNHPMYGKSLSESTRRKIGEKSKGNKHALGCIRSAETKEKMSASKMRPVNMIQDGNIVRTFGSAKSAGDFLGINRKNISLCCLHKRKSAGGYEWSFA